jgi:hypothetical protein
MENGKQAVQSEVKNNPSSILNQALRLLREVEAEIGKLRARSADIEVDPNAKSTQEKLQTEFVDQVYNIINYWHDLPGKTILERIEGAIFLTLVIFDGESGELPLFAVRPIDEDGNEGDDIAGYLHEVFCHKRRERQEKK